MDVEIHGIQDGGLPRLSWGLPSPLSLFCSLLPLFSSMVSASSVPSMHASFLFFFLELCLMNDLKYLLLTEAILLTIFFFLAGEIAHFGAGYLFFLLQSLQMMPIRCFMGVEDIRIPS